MINISNLSLNDTSLKQVQFTQYTKIFKAQNNQLTSSGLNYLLLNCKLRHTVEELYLQNNELDVSSLQYLTVFTCPRLRHVDLRQNRIVQNSVFELKFRQMYKDVKLVLDNQKELIPAVTLQITYTSPLMCSFCLKMFEKIQQQSGSAPTHTQTLKAQAEKLFQKIPRRSSQIMNVNEEPSQSDIDSVNSVLNENGNETPKPDLGKLISCTNEIANMQKNKLQNDLNQIKEEEERTQMQIQHTEKQIREQQKQIQLQQQNQKEYNDQEQVLFQEENEIIEKETEKDKIFKEFALETDLVLKQKNNVANQINEAMIIKPITIQEQKECSFESVKTASGASSLSRSHSNSKLQTTKMRNRNAPKKQETPKIKQKSEENRSLSTSSTQDIKLSVIQQQASVQYQQSLVPLIIAEDLQEIESVPSSTRTVPRYGIHDRFSKTHKPYKSQEDTANINFSQDDILVIKNIPDINRTIKQQLQINQEFRSDALVNHDRQSRIIQILIQYEFLTPQFQSKYKINHLENLGLNGTLTPSKNKQIMVQQTTIIDEAFSESIQHLDSIDTSIDQKDVELPPKNAQAQLALNEGVNLAPLEQSLSKSSKSSLMQKLLVQQQVVEQEIAGLDGNRSQEYLPQNNQNGSYSKRLNVDQQAPQQPIQKAQQQSNEVLSTAGIADYESVNISTLSQLQNGQNELKKIDNTKTKDAQSSVIKLQQIHDNQRNDVSYGNTQFESINESNISEFNQNTKVESKASINAIPKIEQPMTSDKIPLPRNLFQRMTQDLAKVVEEPSFNNTDYGSVDTSTLSGAPQQKPDQKGVELPPKNAQVQLALNEGVNLAPLEQSLSKSSKSSLMQKLLVQQQVVEQEIAGLDGNRSQEYLPQNNQNGSYSKRLNVDQQAPQQPIQKAQQQSNEVLSTAGIADYESVNISTLSQLQNGQNELKKIDNSKTKDAQSSVVKLQQIHDNQRNDVSYGNTQFESINESNISEFNQNTKVESKASINAIPKIEQPMTSDKIPLPRNLFQRMTQDLAKVVEEPSFNNTDYGSVDTSTLSGAPQQKPDQKGVELPPKNAQVQLALNEGVNLAPLEQSLSKSSKSSLMQKLLVQQQVVEQEIAGLDGNRSQEYLPQNNQNGSYSKRLNVDQQAPQQPIQKAQQQSNEVLSTAGIADYESVNISTLSQLQNGQNELKKIDNSKTKDAQSSVVKLQQIHDNQRNDVSYGNTQFESINESNISEFNQNTKVESKASINAIPKIEQPMTSDKIPLPRNLFQRMTQDLAKVVEEPSFNNTDYGSVDTSTLSGAPQQKPDQKGVELPPKNAQAQLALNEGVNLAPLEQSLSKSSKSSLMQKLLVQQQVVEQEIAGLDGNRSQEYLPQNNQNGSYSKRLNVDQQAPQQLIQKAQQQPNEVLSNAGIALTQTNQVQHNLDAESNQISLNQNQIDTDQNEEKPKFNFNFKSVIDNSSQENAFKPFIQNEITKEQSALTQQQQVENEQIYSPDQVHAITNPVVFTVDSVQPIFSLQNETQNTQTDNININIQDNQDNQIDTQQSRPKEQKLNAAVINFAQIYNQIPVKRRILHQPLSQEKFNQFSSPKRHESTFKEEPLKIRKQKIISLKEKQQLQNSIFTLKQSISPSFKQMSKITSIRPNNTLKLKQFTNVQFSDIQSINRNQEPLHQNQIQNIQNQIADDYKNTQLYKSDLNPLQKSVNKNNTDLKTNDLNQNNNPNDLKELLTEYLHLKQFQKPQVLKKTLSNEKRDINPKIQEIVQIENVPIFRVTISPKLQMSDLNAPQPAQSNINCTQNNNIENLMKMSKILDSSDSLDEERIQRLLETKERAKEIQMKKSALRQEEIDKEILRSLVLRNIELENENKAKKIKQ
ncbi:Conserved_hypothetical protein [Hexamita inflata]|uniref:Uncharacterized protein n=1 Tax=Hexamita inflata TaxID=28002 RepID=A0AA86N927_9EUKA|nr:Conserved hypothetical protein [Hexamita inflata]